MASTYTDNGGGVANGSKLDFTFTFPVIQTEDVRVELNALVQETTKYTVDLTSNPTKITFNNTNIDSSVQESTGAPKSGVLVRVFRQTIVGKANGDEDPKAIYAAGSSIRAIDLNANREQALYAIHELQNKPISNSIIADGAITSAKIKDGTITNDDVSTTAAIDGTKISPNFGSQNIVTSGTVDGRDVSVDGTKLDTIESNATADQTAAEIRTLVEAADDSNVFTNDDHDKLANIESGATADQTADDIKTLLQNSPLGSTHLDTNSVGVSQIADSELTTLAGMQSGTASILADATALTSTIAELNQLDGMTKESSITDDDDKFPTSGAVVDYVAAQIAPIGGLEVIATDALFPNTQPPSGVVISIADAGGLVVNGSGTSTTARTVGGSTVTINNIASNFNNSTVDNGVAFLVSSTGSGQTYNYHKATLKEADLLNLSNDINDFAARYRVGSSNPTSNLDGGDLFYNTTINKLLVYNSNTTAWEETQVIGDFNINTLSSSSATGGGSATFNGSAYRFNLSHPPTSAAQMLVSINGVIQKPNAGSSRPSEGFAIDGGDIIFSAAPANGADFFIVTIGAQVSIGTPSSNTVSTSVLQNGSVTNAKVNAGAAIDGTKISPNFGSQNVTTTGNAIAGQVQLQGSSPRIEFDQTDHNTTFRLNSGGGTLQLQVSSNNGASFSNAIGIGGIGNIFIPDNDKVNFGGGNDLVIVHDGSDSKITNKTGNLLIEAKDSETGIKVIPDGSIELYHNNSKKFETTSAGATVTGDLSATGNLSITSGAPQIFLTDNNANSDYAIVVNTGEFRIRDETNSANRVVVNSDGHVDISGRLDVGGGVYCTNDGVANGVLIGAGNDLILQHNGTNSFIDNNTGDLYIQTTGSGDDILIESADDVTIKVAGSETAIQATGDGPVVLYFNNSNKLNTASHGVTVTGDLHLADNNSIKLGSAQEVQINHTGSSTNFVVSQHYLNFQANGTFFYNQAGNETKLSLLQNGAVNLYYDNSKKLETASDGILASGAIRTNAATSGAASANQATFDFNSQNARLLSYHSSGSSISAFTNPSGGSLAERFRIDADGHVLIPVDNKKLKIGAGDDLELYHTGSGSYIADTGTGNLHITTNQLQVINGANTELQATFLENDAVSLYYDNSKKLETNSSGVNIVGSLTVNGSAISSGGLGNIVEDTSPQLGGDLETNGNNIKLGDNDTLRLGDGQFQIFHDGSNSFLNNFTGNLELRPKAGEAGVLMIPNGSTRLYYDGVQKFETNTNGVAVTGDAQFFGATSGRDLTWDASNNHLLFKDNATLELGTSGDLKLYHDGSNSYIQDSGTGDLIVKTNIFRVRGTNDEAIITGAENGNVALYYDNSKKIETDSSGSIITGRLAFNNTGSSIQLADNQKTTFGNGQDLQIFHSGSHSQIIHSGTGNLYLDSIGGSVNLRAGDNAGGVHNSVVCNLNEDVELYYDNVKKFETTSTGGQFFGKLHFNDGSALSGANKVVFGDGEDLQIYHDGNNSFFKSSTGTLYVTSGSHIDFRTTGGSEKQAIFCNIHGAVELYHNNSKKFETTSSGVNITGELNLTDNQPAQFGNSDDLQVFHNGTYSFINNITSWLLIQSDLLALRSVTGTENYLTGQVNAQTELYFDNSKKFQTSSQGCYFLGDDTHWSQGHIYPWNNNDYNLGSASYRWANAFISQAIDFQDSAKAQFGNSDDLQIFHDGGHARINNLTGYITSNSASGHILRSGSSETMLRTEINAEVKLYYDNSEKLRTTTNGAKVTGNYIELDKGSSSGTAFIIDTTATSGATRFRFRENGSTKGQIVYSHDNNQIELAGDSGQSAAILVNFSEYALKAIANGATELYYNGSKKFQTTSSGTELFNRAQLTQSSNDFVQKLDASNSGYSTNIIKIHATRGAASNWAFLAADSNHGGGADREFTLRGDGHAYADNSWNANGADYAEYFESSTGSAIAVGTTVVLENNKVRAATSSDAVADIIGVVRPKEASQASTTIGNAAWNKWQGKYLTDDFDRYILDEHNVIEWTDADGKEHSYGSHAIPSDVTIPSDAKTLTEDEDGNKFVHYRTNPDYDPTKTYVPRHDRDEWVIIGLVGQVKVLKGQAINDRWVKMRDVSDTVQQYFIR